MQDDTLSGDAASVDNSTEQNLNKLKSVGEELLDKRVSRVNIKSGMFEAIGEETNKARLIRCVFVILLFSWNKYHSLRLFEQVFTKYL